jgi:hypothetical protein
MFSCAFSPAIPLIQDSINPGREGQPGDTKSVTKRNGITRQSFTLFPALEIYIDCTGNGRNLLTLAE